MVNGNGEVKEVRLLFFLYDLLYRRILFTDDLGRNERGIPLNELKRKLHFVLIRSEVKGQGNFFPGGKGIQDQRKRRTFSLNRFNVLEYDHWKFIFKFQFAEESRRLKF